MLGLCEITSCRRQVLLSYFGEPEHPPCGNCDTCLEPVPVWDGTDAARKALSAVYRSGQRFGVNHVVDILLGQSTEKVLQNQHQKLSTFGIGKELDKNQWRSVFRQLVARGYLRVDAEGHGVLLLNDTCRGLLRGEETIQLRKDPRVPSGKGKTDFRSAGRRDRTNPAMRRLDLLKNAYGKIYVPCVSDWLKNRMCRLMSFSTMRP
ncbi:MAG: RecQ family zinc-binding domain-containing protein [Nitrincola sp.]|nr:RecQ family zinc-binding domain-containing protein [Nitrincola sp.]